MALFDRITIVGLGLMGGSLGMAIRRRKLAGEVVGLSRHASTIREAVRGGAIEWGTTDAKRAVHDADLVVLATPVGAIVPTAKRLARLMPAGSILTDVGSTKGQIVRELERALPKSVAFVGAHPLAGSEQQGIGAARADLYDDSLCVVTATARTSARALKLVKQLWRPLVQRVLVMDPATHDRLLADVSHLPHALAFCLAQAAKPQARAIAPRSFLDMTRIAQSDPALWADIFLSNRQAILASMRHFDHHWTPMRRWLAQGNRQALQRFLTRAQAIRLATPHA